MRTAAVVWHCRRKGGRVQVGCDGPTPWSIKFNTFNGTLRCSYHLFPPATHPTPNSLPTPPATGANTLMSARTHTCAGQGYARRILVLRQPCVRASAGRAPAALPHFLRYAATQRAKSSEISGRRPETVLIDGAYQWGPVLWGPLQAAR